MEFQESESSGNEEENYSWTLDSVPPEIILHICSFLSAKFVINVLSQVSKKFKAIIESETTWRMRIFERWPKKYPIIPPVEGIDWKVACIEREEQHRLWEDPLENMRKYHIHEAHFGCVNVVKLIEQGEICASGGRDGSIKLWNFDPAYLQGQPFNLPFDFVDAESCLINASHHGNAWLWDITYDSSLKHLYSGGFDCTIKSWDLDHPSETLITYTLPSPILCLTYHDNLLASGSFGRNVSLFDPRIEGSHPILQHKQHKKPVLCIFSDDQYLVTGSEDKSVIVYDKVAAKVLKILEFEHFPLSMSYAEGQLLMGDVNGFLHAIDPTHGDFNLLHTFPSGHLKKVTGVQHSLGSIITCSTDKTIRILEPHVNPESIALVESTNEVASISSYNTILACANVDDSISVWVPQDAFD